MRDDDQSNDQTNNNQSINMQQNADMQERVNIGMFLSTGLSLDDAIDMAAALRKIYASDRLNKQLIAKAKALIADMLKHIEASRLLPISLCVTALRRRWQQAR